MGFSDLHCVIEEEYRNQHIMSDFLKKGVIEKVWSENKSVELVQVYKRDDYNKRKYLASLSGLSIRNEEEIEARLFRYGQ